MFWKRLLSKSVTVLILVSVLLSNYPFSLIRTPQIARAESASLPIVAIHVSEYTQALEAMPAVSPTPLDTGYQWWLTSWHYFVMSESLKIALESDGTPYVLVTDADIATGALMDGTVPKYPIIFSLAAEAITDNEIQPLRDYVNAGGFLFVGSSAFTRNIDGTTRGNFALADEMGLNSVANTLQNWATNSSITHQTDHRLVSHIPTGTITWNLLTTAEDVVWGSNGYQQIWQVNTVTAEAIATDSNGRPLLATNGYGEGRFIYDAIINPLVGAGGYDTEMYAYTIYRNAIEWAFEAANLPIVKRSPWPYAYDAAFMVRHDFENYLSYLNGVVEASAAYEQSVGAKGDYYFCTGILREYTGDKQPYIDSIRRAVINHGATIGSHNGGYPNIGTTPPDDGSYGYWHWGPDTMIDQTSGFPAPYDYYTDGYEYAYDSIAISFQDLEGWLAGTDNGRQGCGEANNCPRTWVSPYFNSGRDRSLKILDQLGASVMGEQKVSPFPHWTLSYDPINSDYRYDHITLPPSDWYVGTNIAQSIEGHNTATIQDLVDFYTDKGYLMNLYGHSGSTSGNMKAYVDYAVAKPHMWATNSVGLYDWWVKRDPMVVTPTYSKVDETAFATATINGATDPEAAIELVLPNWTSGVVGNLEVFINGELADTGEYRTTNYGVKVRVGTTVTNVEVRYQPLEAWTQTDWSGGPDQTIWSDKTKYDTASGIDDTVAGQFSLNLASEGTPLFSDDFNRTGDPPPDPVPFTWVIPGTASGNYGLFDTTAGTLNTSLSSTSHYGFAYKDVPSQPAGDYTIEADIQFPHTTTGGGIFGRLDPATGSRYAAWIYPPSTLRLIRFPSWTATSWQNLGDYLLPAAVGNNWHHLKMVFSGDNIQIYYDNGETPTHNVADSTYTTGFVGVDYWSTTTYGPSYNNYLVIDNLGTEIFRDDFGEDPTLPDLLPPWQVSTGSWSVTDLALRATAPGLSSYASIYYSSDPVWTDYSVQAQVQYPAGAYGGGLVGRLNITNGNRYTAWVYPGSSMLKLLEWSDWDTWNQTPLGEASISAVGTGWHTVRMDFTGNRIRVYWDGSLLIDATDTVNPYLSGGIGFDAYTASSAYLIAADDVEVRGPAEHETSGVLISSAFDGGVGADWHTIAWDAATPSSTSACVRTRTADRADQLAGAAWSECYVSSNTALSSLDKRWIQYQVELATSDVNVSPVFSNIRITYTQGSYLPTSYITYTGSITGDSQTAVNLTATLLDESYAPIIGRIVNFTLEGLDIVSGVTDDDGVASAALSLDIAPGNYLLTVSFVSDGFYGPSSINTIFHVTESWSEWVQDSFDDFGAGIGNGVDTTTSPGSVLLQSQLIGEGEEEGSFLLGTEIWSYRRRMLINNPNTTELPLGYSLKLVVDTAALVSDNKLLESGDDLRIVWMSDATPIELDRVADTAFNTTGTEIWFKSQADIPASNVDNSYYIYYGNLDAGSPPANPSTIFSLYDGFDDIAIDTTLWTQSGTVTESDGWAHLSVGAHLFGLETYTYQLLEMRVQAITEDSYMWWGWEDGISDAPNFMVFEEHPAPTNLTALLRTDGAVYERTSVAQPDGDITTPHIYTTDWRSSQARWYIDGVQVHNDTTGIPDSPMSAIFNASARAFNVDWVRARPSAAEEPVVRLEFASRIYVSQGTFLSSLMNIDGIADWKYLVWDATTPLGTSLMLRVRTALTEGDILTAEWVEYSQSGMLIINPTGRWIQYEATLTTNDSLVSPELKKVTIYYALQNQPPVAVSDSFGMDEDTLLNLAVPGVLVNDSDPDNDTLRAILLTPTAHGELTLNSDGSFIYTPEDNWFGIDSFIYIANDGTEDSSEATVTINVNAVNDAPVVNNDNYQADEDQALTIDGPGVLANDTDVDSSYLEVVLVNDVSHGILSLNSDGSFMYIPFAGYRGTDSFTYMANDGLTDSNEASVMISIITDLMFQQFLPLCFR